MKNLIAELLLKIAEKEAETEALQARVQALEIMLASLLKIPMRWYVIALLMILNIAIFPRHIRQTIPMGIGKCCIFILTNCLISYSDYVNGLQHNSFYNAH